MLRCLCAKRLSRQVAETLGTSRSDISTFAPRIITIKIPVEKIRERIGSGGKTIRSIVERTGVKIDVEDDGRINIASSDDAAAQKVISIIHELTATPELDKVYMGSVQRITDFGAFIEVMPGVDGLLHVSEMANYRVAAVVAIVTAAHAAVAPVAKPHCPVLQGGAEARTRKTKRRAG